MQISTIDLLSPCNYVSYNIKIAELLGLQSAIYISELININEKANRKGKFDKEGYFAIDRDYICQRTSLTKKEIEAIEKKLVDSKILIVKDDKSVLLDIEKLSASLTSKNEEVLENISKTFKKTSKKQSADERNLALLKARVKVQTEELRTAYFSWIDSCYTKNNGWMPYQAVDTAQRAINEFSNFDLDIALGVLEIAGTNGWKDICYSIDEYKRRHKNYSKPKSQPQTEIKLNEKVF